MVITHTLSDNTETALHLYCIIYNILNQHVSENEKNGLQFPQRCTLVFKE